MQAPLDGPERVAAMDDVISDSPRVIVVIVKYMYLIEIYNTCDLCSSLQRTCGSPSLPNVIATPRVQHDV